MKYKETWHLFHILLSLLTCGLWLVVWIWRTLSNSQHNRKVELKLMKESLEEMKRNNRRS